MDEPDDDDLDVQYLSMPDPEGTTRLEMIAALLGNPEATTLEYERSAMAHLIAEIASGIKGADPVDDDFTLADLVLENIEHILKQ